MSSRPHPENLFAALLAVTVIAGAHARPVDRWTPELATPASPGGRFALTDTLWLGGASPVLDGVWDFEDGTVQGWTSVDRSDIPTYVGRDTRDDFIADPVDGVISGIASVWFGIHNVPAREMCYQGGQGYGNFWIQVAEKTYTLGDQPVAPGTQFRYFADSEDGFDFTYLIVETPYSTDTLRTYTGSVFEGTGHGSPTESASDALPLMENGVLSAGEPFTVRFVFVSDPVVSDEHDAWHAYGFDCVNGAFGFDDIVVSNVDLGEGGSHFDNDDFLSGDEGWVFYSMPATGRFLDVADVTTLDPAIPSGCVLDRPDNDYVLTLSDRSLSGPAHPDRQIEHAQSPAAYVGPGSPFEDAQAFFVELDRYDDLGFDQGVGYRVGLEFHPWTCPITGDPTWSIFPDEPTGYYFGDEHCETLRYPSSGALDVPAGTDSVRVVIEVLSGCEFFGYSPCSDLNGNQTPYIDDVRIGVVVPVPETIRVPIDHATIQSAIDAAANGDTIEVLPGTYTGPGNVGLDLAGKSIVLRSASGPQVTTIDAEGTSPVIILDDGETLATVIEGLTLRGGATPVAAGSADGAGVVCHGGAATLRGCIVRDNVATGLGGGIYVRDGALVIEDCVIAGNSGQVAGIAALDSDLLVTDTVLSGNAGTLVGGLGAWGTGRIDLLGCTVTANTGSDAGSVGGLALVGGIDASVERTIVWDDCGDLADDVWVETDASLSMACCDASLAGFVIDGSFVAAGALFSADPLFCDPRDCAMAPTSEGHYGIDDGSPCAPASSPCGELVGAVGSCALLSAPDAAPVALRLGPAVPNPFRSAAHITYTLPAPGRVELTVFDVVGRRVRTLVADAQPGGAHSVQWDGRDARGTPVTSGVYYYRLGVDGRDVVTRSMTLLRR